MSDQGQVEMEMRLSAIESLLTRIYAMILVANTPDQATLERGLDALGDHAATQLFSGFPAVMSDHVSDEFARAIRRLHEATKSVARSLRA